jgi:hypothetical protein
VPDQPRPLPVDLDRLIEAFDTPSWDLTWYLDTESGTLIEVPTELRQELDAVYAELAPGIADEEAHRAAVVEHVRALDLPDEMLDAVLRADEVERGLGIRYRALPGADPQESYKDMLAFIETVADPEMQRRLTRAAREQGAFRRFKDELAADPSRHGQWMRFRDRRLQERAVAWLHAMGIVLHDWAG